MKKIYLASVFLVLIFTHNTYATTATEALTITVDKILAIAANKDLDKQGQKEQLSTVLKSDIDFEALSKRVVSKSWKKATAEQKAKFKDLFSTIVVNTYFALLENYSNEKISYLKEQIKRKKYAIVDTELVSGGKKVPVRYRLIKSKDSWKIYDFVPEGISLISTYKKNYASILKKNGMNGLLEVIEKKLSAKSKE